MKRSFVLLSVPLLSLVVGVISAVGCLGRDDQEIVSASPMLPDLGEIVFDRYLSSIPLPLDTPTVIDRGDLIAHPTGGGGWETMVTRTATHLHLVHESDIGTFRRLERTLPVANLPLRLPDDLSTQVIGHFAIMHLSSNVTGKSEIVSFVRDQRHRIPRDQRTTVEMGGLTPVGPTSAVCWYTSMRRTKTHVIITAGSGIDAKYQETDYLIPLSDLPIDLPTDKIPVTVQGRLFLMPNH